MKAWLPEHTMSRAGAWYLLLAMVVGLGLVVTVSMASADGEPIRVYPLAALNTAADETDPFLAGDQVQFFFVRVERERSRLFLGRRRPAGPVDFRRPLEELDTDQALVSPFLAPRQPDGWEQLYFASKHGSDPRKPNFDIFSTRRSTKEEFQGLVAASPVQAVCSPADELHPWLTADGKELYFSRRANGSWKVMRASGQRPREFDKVEEAGLPEGFAHATVHPSGLIMFVQGPSEAGATTQAIYRAVRPRSQATWFEPQLVVGLGVAGSRVGDLAPSLSPRGDWLYFASDRPGGKGGLDLYYVLVRDLRLPSRK